VKKGGREGRKEQRKEGRKGRKKENKGDPPQKIMTMMPR
jgi:hypothetical protein